MAWSVIKRILPTLDERSSLVCPNLGYVAERREGKTCKEEDGGGGIKRFSVWVRLACQPTFIFVIINVK
jgi:hypothetical protein